jgi:hypothetical protein
MCGCIIKPEKGSVMLILIENGGTLMLKRMLPKTPWGMALTAATVILSVSPEARKAARRTAIKGISAVLSLGDQLKEATASTRGQLAGLMQDAKNGGPEETARQNKDLSFTYDVDIEPEDFKTNDANFPLRAVNVMDEGYVKKQMTDLHNQHH